MTEHETLPVRLAQIAERADSLDPAVTRVSAIVRRLPKPLRDVLHGVPLGHPAHPIAILVPAGAWISAAMLDVLPGGRRAAQTLVAAGIVTATPAVATGLVDWSGLGREQQRVGAVHAIANTAALGLYTASWLARRRGSHVGGAVLGFVGLAVVSASGYLGGHLTYRQGAGVTLDEPPRTDPLSEPTSRRAREPESDDLTGSAGGIEPTFMPS